VEKFPIPKSAILNRNLCLLSFSIRRQRVRLYRPGPRNAPSRLVPHPYDAQKREEAEERQMANLREVKRTRNSQGVSRSLKALKGAAQKEEENLIPYFIDCVKEYVTIQEMCDVLREVFGEAQPMRV